jgi:hypothetical protein
MMPGEIQDNMPVMHHGTIMKRGYNRYIPGGLLMTVHSIFLAFPISKIPAQTGELIYKSPSL